jgi:hypothetical protein
VILPNQVLEVAVIGKQVGIVRVDKPVAYLDINDTGLAEGRSHCCRARTPGRRQNPSDDSELGPTP